MTYKTYNQLLLGGMGIAVAILCGATLYYQPLVGDLTRLGGYTENDFGWNGEELVFKPVLAANGNISEHYDVIVVGDSFSTRTTPDRQTPYGGFWTDFLAEMTGLSVGVFDLNKVSLDKILASPKYRSTPPRLVIYQSVERALDVRFPAASPVCLTAIPGPTVPIKAHPRGLSPERVPRRTSGYLSEQRFNETVAHFNKSIRRWLKKGDGTPVLRVPLSRSDIFTHRQASEILLFADDLAKKQWTFEKRQSIRCELHRYQQAVEVNGMSRFVALIAPDKSTVYEKYLPLNFDLPHLCPILSADTTLHIVCVDAALKEAVASGVRDVYYPNDTHWNSPGAQIAAQRIADYIARD